MSKGFSMPSAVKRKYDLEYIIWRKKVLDRCGGKCVKCGSYEKIQAHHINSWRNFPELRFSVDNGEAVCLKCHIEIHPFMVKYLKKKKIKPFKNPKKKKLDNFLRKNGFNTKKKPKITDHYKDYRFSKDNPNPNWSS